jgi:prepilin-type processing-associated H-X9-DG protein
VPPRVTNEISHPKDGRRLPDAPISLRALASSREWHFLYNVAQLLCLVGQISDNRVIHGNHTANAPMPDPHTDQADPTPEPTYQFSLKTLFVLPLFVVAYFALAQVLGACLAVALVIPLGLLVACFYAQTHRWAVRLLVGYLVLGVFVVLLLPMGHGPGPARRSQCCNNLKQIGIALHNYHDTYGSFPPAYIADDEGRPIHSWRVLLLPFLENEALYEQYRFDEPWNGPNNIKLVEKMPTIFQCPSNRSEEKTHTTNYVVVVGPHTVWPGEETVRFKDITDGTSNAWLVVEVADSGITWSEPRDLHVLQMAQEINPPAGQGISSKHIGGAQVLYADGSVRFIADASLREDIRRLLTIDDGEKVDLDQ